MSMLRQWTQGNTLDVYVLVPTQLIYMYSYLTGVEVPHIEVTPTLSKVRVAVLRDGELDIDFNSLLPILVYAALLDETVKKLAPSIEKAYIKALTAVKNMAKTVEGQRTLNEAVQGIAQLTRQVAEEKGEAPTVEEVANKAKKTPWYRKIVQEILKAIKQT